jgi:hypothetical protein
MTTNANVKYCKNIEGKGLVTTSIFQGKELRFY